jgi:thioredoxin reductase (NADPH)
MRGHRFRTPVYDEATFETSRPGLYLAGTVCGGYQTNRWFIENGRFHARQIARHIAQGRADPLALEGKHWKTEE